MKSISVIIPVYNAELTLADLYDQLIPVLETLAPQFEVIMVEDRGKDRSWEVIKSLSAKDKRVRGIRLSRNFGQHNALLCGIRAARYEVIVTMDDDLQNPVSEIAILLSKFEEGFDVVYGTPDKQQHGMIRTIATQITKLVLKNAMGVETARKVSAFRVFREELRTAFEDYRSPFVSIDVLLTWGTTKFGTVKVKHAPRLRGRSNYTVKQLLTHAMNLLTGFSTLPLQIASFVGFFFAIFGLGVLAWVLGRYALYGSPVAGFPFLASIIAIFSGAQLFALGIFGEYLARMHFRAMNRPAYVVAESADQVDGGEVAAVITKT